MWPVTSLMSPVTNVTNSSHSHFPCYYPIVGMFTRETPSPPQKKYIYIYFYLAFKTEGNGLLSFAINIIFAPWFICGVAFYDSLVHSTVQWSVVLYCTDQYSTVMYSTVQHISASQNQQWPDVKGIGGKFSVSTWQEETSHKLSRSWIGQTAHLLFTLMHQPTLNNLSPILVIFFI